MNKRYFWDFAGAGRLIYGSGVVNRLGKLVQKRGCHHLLIITDTQLMKAGVVQPVVDSLAGAGIQVTVFAGGEPEPSLDAAARAAEAAKSSNPDAILGLGGGSNIDLAKMAAVLHTFGGNPPDYFGFDQVPGPVLPLIAVPTTAGTGSEVSHAAVLTDTANQMKVSTLSPYLRPVLAVVDPCLTLSCPPKATADSGIDALTHAIEACTAVQYDELEVPPEQDVPYPGCTPIGECLAERAIHLIGRNLVTAVTNPGNLEAREGMSLAATLAGLAFSNCAVAVVHALEYPLGGAVHCSHGAGNGLLLPYVMRFNLPVREKAFARIARLLGAATDEQSDPAAAEAAVIAVEELKDKIGIPERLRDLGLQRDQIPALAEKAFAIERLMLLNPRRPAKEDLLEILEKAY